jgi:hypothetical protein
VRPVAEVPERGLFSDDELQFRDEVHHEPSVRPYRLWPAPLFSSASLLLSSGRIRLEHKCYTDVALVLVELA